MSTEWTKLQKRYFTPSNIIDQHSFGTCLTIDYECTV